MDRDQFEEELSVLKDGHLTEIDIVEEGNGNKGDDGDVERVPDGGKDVYKSTTKIFDLPVEMLWGIMKPLDGGDLCSVAGTHQKRLHASKYLMSKDFTYVRCVPTVRPDSPRYAQTPEVLEILLQGASVTALNYNSDARPIDVEGLRLEHLELTGNERSPDFAAIVIEKLKPKYVFLEDYLNYTITPRLGQALSTIGTLFLGPVGMELLGFITECKFEYLRCQLKNENGEMPAGFFDVIRQLLDQYKNGERSDFLLEMEFHSVLQHDQLHSNVFGPDYPLEFRGGLVVAPYYYSSSPSFTLIIDQSSLTMNSDS